MALYSDFAKKYLTESNFIDKNQAEVTGCPRPSESFSLKKIYPKDQILYYAIENDRGLPNVNVRLYGDKFFKDLNDHKYFDSKIQLENSPCIYNEYIKRICCKIS